ncbi:hypothetical protein HZC32_01775 [Candidatus Woesearchaeota archaeon]|nr:hypothetical protein [Candidatus Woesearchaeota archaeon]
MVQEMALINRKISMVAAASEALTYRKKNPGSDSDRVLRYISKNVAIGKDEMTKIGMIAAASEALSIAEKQPTLNEKEVIRMIMGNIPNILSNINSY